MKKFWGLFLSLFACSLSAMEKNQVFIPINSTKSITTQLNHRRCPISPDSPTKLSQRCPVQPVKR